MLHGINVRTGSTQDQPVAHLEGVGQLDAIWQRVEAVESRGLSQYPLDADQGRTHLTLPSGLTVQVRLPLGHGQPVTCSDVLAPPEPTAQVCSPAGHW